MMMFQTLARVMRGNEHLAIGCETCGHRVQWTRDATFARLGPDATPDDVRRKLVCGQCGSGKAIRLNII